MSNPIDILALANEATAPPEVIPKNNYSAAVRILFQKGWSAPQICLWLKNDAGHPGNPSGIRSLVYSVKTRYNF